MTADAAALLEHTADRFPDGDLLIALSGGPDSAVAAWLAVQARGSAAVRALHVHHGQQASDRLQEAAAAVAAALGIQCDLVEIEIAAGASFETRARQARLQALADAAAPAALVVTGHHRDDQAETVLGNLVRGAGARGLAGIPATRGPFLRPLIDVAGDTIRRIADSLKLPYLDDPSNFDTSHTRNLIRHEVLPALEEQLGPGVASRLADAAGRLATDDRALEDAAEPVPVRQGYAGAVLLPSATLQVVDAAVAVRIVQRALRLAHPPYGGSSADVAAVLDVARRSGRKASLSGGYIAEREGPSIAIHRGDLGEPPRPRPLPIPGAVTFGPATVAAAPAAGEAGPIGPTAVVADVGAGSLQVRAAAEGERIEISGGTKPVRDAMSESWIPARLRAHWPVVVADGRILWIAGSRLADWARPDTQDEPITRVMLRLSQP